MESGRVGIELVLNRAAQRSILRIEHRRCISHCDRLALGTDCKLQVEAHSLQRIDRHVLLQQAFETLRCYLYHIVPCLQRRYVEVASAVRRANDRDRSRGVCHLHLRIGNDRAACIRDRPLDVSVAGLSEQRQAGHQEKTGDQQAENQGGSERDVAAQASEG